MVLNIASLEKPSLLLECLVVLQISAGRALVTVINWNLIFCISLHRGS